MIHKAAAKLKQWPSSEREKNSKVEWEDDYDDKYMHNIDTE